MNAKQIMALQQIANHPGRQSRPIHFGTAKTLIRTGLITLTLDASNYRHYEITDMGRQALDIEPQPSGEVEITQ